MNTEILFIMDRSGSTQGLSANYVQGFNKFLDEQKAVPGDARMTFIQFNSTVHPRLVAVPLSDVKPLTLEDHHAEGYTALRDAIGLTLDSQGERIAREQWAEVVVCVIVTDGLENVSHVYSDSRIREMITHAEAHGWKFVYLGANQDAFAVAQNMGILRGSSMTYGATGQGVQDMYVHTCSVVGAARTGQVDPFQQQKAPA